MGYFREKPEEEIGVTVCAAAIAGNMVIGISDRMLTAGDIQFEPKVMKVWYLTSSIQVMTAGDSALHAELFKQVAIKVGERLQDRPDEWVPVREVARWYAEEYARTRARRAELVVLYPLGLNLTTFLQEQRKMAPELVTQLTDDLSAYEIPKASALIVGVDEVFDQATPQIFKVRGAKVADYGYVAFAAIGIGANHAESQFMFAGHTRNEGTAETALLAMTAKKRAEAAPGVGPDTDMFSIGPAPGTYTPWRPQLVEVFEVIYKQSQRAAQSAKEEAKKQAKDFLDRLLAASASKGEQKTKQASEADQQNAAEEEDEPVD